MTRAVRTPLISIVFVTISPATVVKATVPWVLRTVLRTVLRPTVGTLATGHKRLAVGTGTEHEVVVVVVVVGNGVGIEAGIEICMRVVLDTRGACGAEPTGVFCLCLCLCLRARTRIVCSVCAR